MNELGSKNYMLKSQNFIDTHVHLWDLNNRYPWIENNSNNNLKQNYLIQNLMKDAESLSLKKMSYDGRIPDVPWRDQNISTIGYHYYMTPEDAARGIILMDQIPKKNLDSGNNTTYSDLSTKKVFYE